MNSGVNTKKKALHLKKMREFLRILGWNHKKRIFITKSAKKQFLLTNSGVITSILGVSDLELHFSGTELVTFFGVQSSLGGTVLVWGAKAVILGARPWNAPRGVGPAASYSNLSNCNYRIFVKEILLEMGFIEEMRTIWGDKEVPETFFHNFLYLRKYDLIR